MVYSTGSGETSDSPLKVTNPNASVKESITNPRIL